MKIKTTLGFVLILSAASAAHAQTKISGVVQCSKPAPEQKIAVGDSPGHIFLINQFKCPWTKPMEIERVPDE